MADDYQLGPKMSVLTPRQQAFVLALLELGGKNQGRAARMAGFTGTDNAINVTATRLIHDEKVQEAIAEEARRRFSGLLILAVSNLMEILETSPSATVKLRAIQMVLDRAGLPTETVVTHKEDENQRAQLERIARMATTLGLDPRKLLGNAGITVDAEFTEVTKVDPSENEEEW